MYLPPYPGGPARAWEYQRQGVARSWLQCWHAYRKQDPAMIGYLYQHGGAQLYVEGIEGYHAADMRDAQVISAHMGSALRGSWLLPLSQQRTTGDEEYVISRTCDVADPGTPRTVYVEASGTMNIQGRPYSYFHVADLLVLDVPGGGVNVLPSRERVSFKANFQRSAPTDTPQQVGASALLQAKPPPPTAADAAADAARAQYDESAAATNNKPDMTEDPTAVSKAINTGSIQNALPTKTKRGGKKLSPKKKAKAAAQETAIDPPEANPLSVAASAPAVDGAPKQEVQQPADNNSSTEGAPVGNKKKAGESTAKQLVWVPKAVAPVVQPQQGAPAAAEGKPPSPPPERQSSAKSWQSSDASDATLSPAESSISEVLLSKLLGEMATEQQAFSSVAAEMPAADNAAAVQADNVAAVQAASSVQQTVTVQLAETVPLAASTYVNSQAFTLKQEPAVTEKVSVKPKAASLLAAPAAGVQQPQQAHQPSVTDTAPQQVTVAAENHSPAPRKEQQPAPAAAGDDQDSCSPTAAATAAKTATAADLVSGPAGDVCMTKDNVNFPPLQSSSSAASLVRTASSGSITTANVERCTVLMLGVPRAASKDQLLQVCSKFGTVSRGVNGFILSNTSPSSMKVYVDFTGPAAARAMVTHKSVTIHGASVNLMFEPAGGPMVHRPQPSYNGSSVGRAVWGGAGSTAVSRPAAAAATAALAPTRLAAGQAHVQMRLAGSSWQRPLPRGAWSSKA